MRATSRPPDAKSKALARPARDSSKEPGGSRYWRGRRNDRGPSRRVSARTTLAAADWWTTEERMAGRTRIPEAAGYARPGSRGPRASRNLLAESATPEGWRQEVRHGRGPGLAGESCGSADGHRDIREEGRPGKTEGRWSRQPLRRRTREV